MQTAWWKWMQNRGPVGYSAPFLTLDKFRPLATSVFKDLWGIRLCALHYWRDGTSYKFFDQHGLERFEQQFLKGFHQSHFLEHFSAELCRKAEQTLESAVWFKTRDLEKQPTSALRLRFESFMERYYQLGAHSMPLIFGSRALECNINALLIEHLTRIGESPDNLSLCRMYLTRSDEKSWFKKEQEELATLAAAINNNPTFRKMFQGDLDAIERDVGDCPDLALMIRNHVDRWCWIDYKWIGPVLTHRDFVKRILAYLGTRTSVASPDWSLAVRIVERFSTDEGLANYCIGLRTLTELKELESGLVSQSAYHLHAFRKEIARRFDLDESLTEQMIFDDYVQLLNNGRCDRAELDIRRHLFLWLLSEEERILSGDQAEMVIGNELTNSAPVVDCMELQGMSANPGKAEGFVLKAVELKSALERCRSGQVLATFRTTPAHIPLILNATAILTGEHGLTQHAAVISREMNKPCIVGIQSLMDLISDNEFVSVDATTGRVTRKPRSAMTRHAP
jgi:phosphohistidine swiveling domain-containing protein